MLLFFRQIWTLGILARKFKVQFRQIINVQYFLDKNCPLNAKCNQNLNFLFLLYFAGFANFGSCDFHLIKPPLFRGESKQQLRAATSNCDLQFIKHCRSSLSLFNGLGFSHLRFTINISYKAETFG